MKNLLAFLFICLASICNAGSCEWSWTANISEEVRVNSKGKKLSSLGQVLAQERYIFWANFLPDQIDKIRGDTYWTPELSGKNTFHYKGNRQILADIPEEKFVISDRVRKAFWTCSNIEVRVKKSGWDCDANATGEVTITAENIDHCF